MNIKGRNVKGKVVQVAVTLREPICEHLEKKAEEYKMGLGALCREILDSWVAMSKERERLKAERESKFADTPDVEEPIEKEEEE
jgi:hypothetical protein